MVASFNPSKILLLYRGNGRKHMEIIVLFYFVWSLQAKIIKTFSYENYKEFTITICEGQCKKVSCPSITVIKMQRILIMDGYLNDDRCLTVKKDDEESFDNPCNQKLQIEISEKSVSKCSNKSECFFCHRREYPERYERCKKTTATRLFYICVSDQSFEEIVPANSYVDLTCAQYVEHKIIILKASLIPNHKETNFLKKNLHVNNTCSQTDVTSLISQTCSTKYKCQAGPNSLISKDCSSKKLQLMYSCVPESILKVNNENFGNSLILGSKVQVITNKPISDDIYLQPLNQENKISQNQNETFDYLWLICLFSVISVISVTIIIFIYCCRSRRHVRHNSLSTKIKLANFSPPPTSIEKIEIDLACHNPMLPDLSMSYHSHIRNDIHQQYQNENNDIEFWNKTLYPLDTSKGDIQSSSLSAGSSGQLSPYHSDTSKGNPSTVFNYITREKCPPDQTPL